jgi:hypothetical protein
MTSARCRSSRFTERKVGALLDPITHILIVLGKFDDLERRPGDRDAQSSEEGFEEAHWSSPLLPLPRARTMPEQAAPRHSW